jgi:HEAT repeat protein/beta-lactamase regulating signal transducer with metallopeptidase domain
MMTMATELPVSWLPLADAVIKASFVLGCAAAASFALRRASAALRHLIWTLALCSALALPLLSVVLPKWHLPILTVSGDQPVVNSPIADHNVANDRTAPPLGRQATVTGAPAMPHSLSAMQSDWTSSDRLAWTRNISWQQALFGIWIIGAAAILARLVIGLILVRLLSRRTQLITDAPWLPMACRLAADLGIRSDLHFLRSGRARMPVAAGILRPSVIMPADADTWPESRLRIVLLHELAHVRRRDCLTHLLAQIACALYWFNPLAWIAAKRLRTERERACDDLVLASGTRGSDYADQLLEIARAMQGDRFPGLLAGASLAMAHRSQLEGRLIAILDPKVPRVGVSRASGFAAVVLCSCAVAPLGALQPWKAAGVDVNVTNPVSPANPSTSSVHENVSNTEASTQISSVVNAAPQAPKQPAVAARQEPTTRPPALPEMPAQPARETIAHTAAAIAEALTHVDIDAAIAGGVAESQTQTPTPTPSPEPKVSTKGGSGRQADPRMIAALTAALKDTDKDVRETAMHALVQLRDPSILEPLMQALKDPSADVREQAAFGLGQMRDRRAVQPLIAALKDQAANVREQAAFALGQLRDPAAVEALGTVLHDASDDVREQAVFALGQIRDPRATDPLIVALKDQKADVREQAAFALGQLRARSAVDALIVAIKDTNADVREQIAFALGQIRDPRAIDALTTLLKDQVADVRQQAAFALGQLAR